MTAILSRMARTIAEAARAFDEWLRNALAMIRAGRDIAWQLRTSEPGARDHAALLWRAYENYGVVLKSAETAAEREMKRREAMVTTVDECLTLARAELKVARAKVTREIRNYPTPIAGCDCQFNHLLFERTRISAALRTLDPECSIPTAKAL